MGRWLTRPCPTHLEELELKPIQVAPYSVASARLCFPQLRMPSVLKDLDEQKRSGVTYRALAQQLGCTADAVENALRRYRKSKPCASDGTTARQKIRERLNERRDG